MKEMITTYARMMEKAVPGKDFAIRMWDDDLVQIGDHPLFTLWFKTESAFSRTVKDQFLGFAESYVAGDIEIEGDDLLLFRMGHTMGIGGDPISLMEKLKFLVFCLRHRNTRSQSKKNIAHYNLGNDLYSLFLDKSMAYTCAYFHSPDQVLEQAQADKYDHVCQKLLLKPGETLVDLGCGWGGLLIHAAKHYGITGTGVTLSKAQHALAEQRARETGLANQIQFLLNDYRETPGTFDKVSCIGMMEHVGKSRISELAVKIKELLNPGGLGLLHFIGNDTPYPDDPWTIKYIFPGGHVPALDHVIRELSLSLLSILDVENLRMHYVYTIQHWLERFESHRDIVLEKYGETFYRSFQLYLKVSLGSFEYGGNRLFHVLFSNGLNNDLPLTRDHIYRKNIPGRETH